MTLLLALALLGCTDPEPDPPARDTARTDDRPADSGTPDSQAPDSGTGDTAPSALDDDLLAVVGDYGEEVRFFLRTTGELWASQRLSSWFPSCVDETCRLLGFQHRVVDDVDELSFAYTRPVEAGQNHLGGALAVLPGAPGEILWDFLELDFDTWLTGIYGGACDGGAIDPSCRMSNPHTVARTPAGHWLVADTAQDRVLLVQVDPDQTPVKGVVRAVLDATTLPDAQWESCEGPNNVETWVEDERLYALVTCRGDEGQGGGMTRHGSVTLWDVTDPDAIDRVWRFPERGFLKAAHHGRVLDLPSGPLLVYGHSMGDSGADDEEWGTVGLARFAIDRRPTYLGDGRLPEALGRFGFVRSVSALPGDEGLLIADSGCEKITSPCEATARIVEVALPDLDDPSLDGGWSEDHEAQRFFELTVDQVLEEALVGHPYEAEVLALDGLGAALRTPDGVVP